MYWNLKPEEILLLILWLIETWDVLKLKYNVNIYKTGSD